MFLEETIEALEVQEDSGLSNDEPDSWTIAKDHTRVNGVLLFYINFFLSSLIIACCQKTKDERKCLRVLVWL